jgi:hypothetical protein
MTAKIITARHGRRMTVVSAAARLTGLDRVLGSRVNGAVQPQHAYLGRFGARFDRLGIFFHLIVHSCGGSSGGGGGVSDVSGGGGSGGGGSGGGGSGSGGSGGGGGGGGGSGGGGSSSVVVVASEKA